MKYKVGDLIKAAQKGEVNVIAHGANCFNTMKSGIAPKIAKAFPSAWDADQKTKRGDKEKLGTSTHVYSNGVMVFNLYSQFGWWGRKQNPPVADIDYAALRNSLLEMRALLDEGVQEVKIGLPKIGAGLAGGNWKLIESIISETLQDFDVTIYVLRESDLG